MFSVREHATPIALDTGVRWERLTPQADPGADFLYVVYDVGGSSCQGDRFIRHSGREYGVVLSGTLEVTVGFDKYELGPGDSVCFDSTVPHCLRTVGDERGARRLVCHREAERPSHERLRSRPRRLRAVGLTQIAGDQ